MGNNLHISTFLNSQNVMTPCLMDREHPRSEIVSLRNKWQEAQCTHTVCVWRC